jgi:hypothetical protein
MGGQSDDPNRPLSREPKVKLVCARDIEDAQNWDDGVKADLHNQTL